MLNYKEMPKGVIQIHLIQVFSLFGFATLLGLLNFYLSNDAGFTKTQANTITASFFALNFLLHFLGGAVGGRYFSFRGLLVISFILQIVSMFFIANRGDSHIILIGLAMFVTGTGVNTSCVNMMLTQRFSSDDGRRRVAFSINYSCMNIGFFGTFIIAGIIQGYGDYTYAFYIAAVFLFISLLIHLANYKNVYDHDTYFSNTFHKLNRRYVVAPAILIACFLLSLLLMNNPEYGPHLIVIVFIAVAIYLFRLAITHDNEYRIKILVFVILSSSMIVYALVQGMMSSAFENFVEFNTNKSLFGIHIEPAMINAFENLGVIISGILLAIYTKKRLTKHNPIGPGTLVARGILLNVIAFLVVPLGILLANPQTGIVNVAYPVILMFFIAAGEVHVNATTYAMVGDLIKPIHQGIFTGYMFICVAIGIVISGPVSNYAIGNQTHAENITALGTNHLYLKIFLTLAIVTAFISVFFFLISKKVNKVFSKVH
ncbi:peptide transporter [Candidatus Francisella endociliophora]|uniref:Peptide transporter n=1 Tax=Candidatus Francisella endociliophora TaxID=653937 RepID=A0A097ERE4_9GAMM|nr:MFS transporter [Francisella sp. FSC1006]AIT10143.1 peptide transporter [Francisella sp. FSC1006]